MGMGDDGHTASLFPQTDALGEADRWFVENWVEKFGAHRYTLTGPAIQSGTAIWFLITGENKRDALANVWRDGTSPVEYPAKLIQPHRWYVTKDALG